jgi:hypothetical protein
MACQASPPEDDMSSEMRRHVQEFKRLRRSQNEFPDEVFARDIESMKTNHPSIMAMIKFLEYGDEEEGIPPFIEFLDAMRQTRTYKAYPISLGDENRLFMTLFSYHVIHLQKLKSANTGEELFEILTSIIDEDIDTR